MCVVTTHHLNYSGQESKERFAGYDSDIPVTLKYGQSPQHWYELLDPRQDYNHAKFERPPLNSVRQGVNVKVLVKAENMSVFSLECVQK